MKQDREPRNKFMNLCQLIFNKGAKNAQWGKDSLFNKVCWETVYPYLKPLPYTTHKSQLKIKDLNIRPQTGKCL